MFNEDEGKADDDYEVGYRKPPKHGQFKPGVSGNKKGRPKGAKSLQTLARDILNEKIEVTEGGEPKKIKKSEALVRKLFTSAMKGELRAGKMLMELQGPDDDKGSSEVVELQEAELIDFVAFANAITSGGTEGDNS